MPHRKHTPLLPILIHIITVATAHPARNIDILLNAPWDATPKHAEALAYFATPINTNQQHAYYAYAEALAAPPAAADADTASIDELVRLASPLLEPLGRSVLRAHLAAGVLSPMVEMWRKLGATEAAERGVDAGNTTAWLHVCGTGEYRAATGAPSSAFEDTTRRAIAGAASAGCALPNSADERAHSASAPLGVDVVHPGSEVGGLRPPLVVLYAPLGADVFLAAHRLLADASARGQVTYVFRPLVRAATAYAERQPVQGYGVELAIKNMEYKAMDDDKATADKGAEGDEGAEGADAGAGGANALSDDAEHGFFFQTLAARRPELKEDLSALREALASSADSEDASNLKVWAMQDLGLQAAARVLRARKPLATLRELVQNFPLLARGLSRAAVDRDLEAEVERMHGVWGESYASATLNGRPLSLMRENDISDILASIRTQASAIDELASLDLDANATRSIISLPIPSAQLRVDTMAGSDALVYLNDVEKDKTYARFRKPLAELLEPNMYGQMNFCRRNIFHLVFVVDPSTDLGMSALEYALGLMENGIPFRFGIVLAPPPLPATATSTNAAPDAARLAALRARVASLGLSNVSEARLRELGEQSAAADAAAAAVGESSGTAAGVSAATVDDEAVAMGRLLTKLFLYIRSKAGGTAAMRFLSAANEVRSVGGGYFSAPTFDPLSVDHIERAYEFTASRSKKLDADVLDEMREGSHSEWEEAANAGGAFLKAKGLEATTQLLLNGFPVPLTTAGMQEEVMSAIQDEWRTIKGLVSSGALADDSPNLLSRLAELTPTFPRLNPGLLVEPESVDVLRLTRSAAMEDVAWVSAPVEDDAVALVSAILMIDLTVTSDLLLAGHALKALEVSPGSRLGFLLCPRRTTSDAAWHAQLATAWLSAASSTSALRGLSELVRSRIEGVDPIGGGDAAAMPARSALCDEWGASDTGATILVNGRLVRAVDLPPLDWVDLKLLLEFERTQRAEGVAGVIGALQPPEGVKGGGSAAAWRADTIMYAAAAAARGVKSASAGGGGGSRRDAASASLLQGAACGAACVRLEGSGRAAALELTVAMDPLTKQAQRVATVLESLHDSLGLTVTLHLVPRLRISSFPLESFYRFVFDLNAHRAISGGGGGGTGDGHAIFSALRTPKVLTLHVDAPEAWLIECVEASYDMDNIRLGDLGERRTLFATYEIQSLLLTGSCEDLSSGGQPPNGLELRLGTRTSPHEADTLVMSNLGYFQLKALPGVWDLDLAPGTPSSNIYELVASPALLSTGHSMEAARRVQLRTDDSALVPVPTLRVAVSSYRGEYSLILVRKREGMESRSVLDSAATKEMGGSEGDVASEAAGGGGAFSSLSKWFGTGDGPSSSLRSGEVVHIFSLASGHLYERFLKIMMQSVLDGTRRRVKFWLLKNFLSPAFISYLPAMAAELDFEYGLVQYQWPSWLHKQTEKQRIIWGYKILFLDVMFPLSVRKIIYIDADQVVNADVGELWDMSLGKAAIGMTPFCTKDANPDTLGFRFFAQGYWKDHLAGKPYHISALFIVDLHKFRRRAYGDHYRILYDSLSKDPNSLANLDQDLPNFAQHQVAIKSLPEAWLWCETWCGNATKHKAKTIDLCNNPLTKEPKLDQATRVIGERWSAYDRRSREMEELGARGRENAATAREQPAATAAAKASFRDEL